MNNPAALFIAVIFAAIKEEPPNRAWQAAMPLVITVCAQKWFFKNAFINPAYVNE
jgi:hypothetical protein